MTDAALALVSERLARLQEIRRYVIAGHAVSFGVLVEAFLALPAGARSAAERAIVEGLDQAITAERRLAFQAMREE